MERPHNSSKSKLYVYFAIFRVKKKMRTSLKHACLMIFVQICLYSSRSVRNMAILGMVQRHEDATGGWSENRTCKAERKLDVKRIDILEKGFRKKKKHNFFHKNDIFHVFYV